MAEQRLIDANGVRKKIKNSRARNSVKVESLVFVDCAPTICPETLPIVRQLREENARLNRGISNLSENVKSAYEQRDKIQKELARMTAERDAAIKDIPKNCNTCASKSNPTCEGNKKYHDFGFQENCECWTWNGKRKEE